MSQATAMEVDEGDDKTTAKKEAIVRPKSTVKLITSTDIRPASSIANSRIIQTVSKAGTSAGGKPPKLQIVKLVTQPGQQQMLKIQGAPVRVVTAGAAPTKIHHINPAPSTVTTTSIAQPAKIAVSQAKVITSQRLILPASSKPLAPQLVTIPVSHNTARLQSVLSTGSTVFSPAVSGGQVVAFLSPQKPTTTTSRQVQVVAHSASTSSARGYVQISTAGDAVKSEPLPVKKEATSDSGQRKPCNCTKSHCLKLYCDCFAKGEFCSNCNCVGCANVLSKEEQRQKAIKQCLMRNPNAFHPKIGKGESAEVRRHQKGCNCKRSGCLKNYCECFEARIMCGTMCKCVGCKNCEDSSNNSGVSLMRMADAAMVKSMQLSTSDKRSQAKPGLVAANSPNRMRDSMQEHLGAGVIEGVLDCLLMQCHEAEAAKCKPDTCEKLILEEFGRCLSRIIQSANESSSKSS